MILHTCVLLLALSQTIYSQNPGLLLQIPSTYAPPLLEVPLPQPITSMLIRNLQLTNIQLRDLTYSWKMQELIFVVSIPGSLISFDWEYGKDKGEGTFEQTFQILNITFGFFKNRNNRFQIDIEKAIIKPDEGKSKITVHLGGGAKETVITEVTNLIINNARIAFREAISKAIQSLSSSFSAPFQKDPELICPSKKCIYLNTTLVAQPIITKKLILIQINGAPYLTGTSSGTLNPKDVLFKTNSTKISAQIHEQVLQSIGELYQKEKYVTVEVKASQISSIADITSQTLSVVFPQMKKFLVPKDVLFNIQVGTVSIQIAPQKDVKFEVELKGSIMTQKFSNDLPDPYIDEVSGLMVGSLSLISNSNRISIKLNQLNIGKIDFSTKDVEEKKVAPPALEKYISVLMNWAGGAFTGGNNEQINLDILSWKCDLSSNVLDKSIQLQIDLHN